MVCDSNVIIDYLNGDKVVIDLLRAWRRERHHLVISPITITEVLGLPGLKEREIRIARLFLDEFDTVPLDAAMAHYAASLRRAYGIKTPDSLIAATAMMHFLPLVSRDKQFRAIEELDLVVP